MFHCNYSLPNSIIPNFWLFFFFFNSGRITCSPPHGTACTQIKEKSVGAERGRVSPPGVTYVGKVWTPKFQLREFREANLVPHG